MNITRRQILYLLARCRCRMVKYVLAGTPEDAPNYNATDHWWGMLINIYKVHRLR